MTRLLLDYPWPLEAGLGPDAGPQNVLRDYLHLLERTRLAAVRFIEDEECVAFWKYLEGRKGRGRFDLVMRLISHCKRNSGGLCNAAPVPVEPPNLRESWKRALRDELGDLTDWRNPQIVVSTLRCSDWQPVGNEAAIHCGPCEDQQASAHLRVLVVLEDYAAHPFALSDCDPWDVRRTVASGKHPCYLPNPLIPDRDPLQNHFCRVPIDQLYDGLAEVHKRGWQANGKYFFIPPADWQPKAISQVAWREGRAFPRKFVQERQQTGYSDFAGRVWVWHEGEDHWDVQLGGTDYIRVNHTGDPL